VGATENLFNGDWRILRQFRAKTLIYWIWCSGTCFAGGAATCRAVPSRAGPLPITNAIFRDTICENYCLKLSDVKPSSPFRFPYRAASRRVASSPVASLRAFPHQTSQSEPTVIFVSALPSFHYVRNTLHMLKYATKRQSFLRSKRNSSPVQDTNTTRNQAAKSHAFTECGTSSATSFGD